MGMAVLARWKTHDDQRKVGEAPRGHPYRQQAAGIIAI